MHLFFSTPVWASKINNYSIINEELQEYINNKRKLNPDGIFKSNKNGWHSEDFNLQEEIPKKFVNVILENINQAISDMGWDTESQLMKISNMWAIINTKGAYNERHHHQNSALSAAYYVCAPENCGNINFYDPRPAPVYSHPYIKNYNSLNSKVNYIVPSDGLLVLFPSYLDHSVSINKSEKERMVISFNIPFYSK